ncbi:MAG: hypothetical protein JWM17_1693, partial [Actinobacteria bacterium]|nr:hypothetical protein [Actinomycetota bacterium]
MVRRAQPAGRPGPRPEARLVGNPAQAKDFLPTSLPVAGSRAHHPPGADGARPANLLGVAEQLLVAQPGHLAQQG